MASPFCTLAKKVHMIKQTGDVTKDTMKSIERDALVKIIDGLVKNGDWVLPMHGIMNSQELDKMNKERTKSSSGGENDDCWKGDYDTFKQLPEAWKNNFMCGTATIPDAVMAQVADKDPSMFDVLFEYELQMRKDTEFPPEMKDVIVCSQTCDRRSHEKGRRLLLAYTAGYIHADGTVEYGKLCFDPKVNDQGEVTEVHHIGGEKAGAPTHMPMNKEFKMWDNHFDLEAKMVLQKPGALLFLLLAYVCACGCVE